ncbi:MAG TPA: hypothetical protein VMG32_09545 [Anaeromyxobacteraceae bacterium]|nr:hypothetical protein [Anaeromyxobacteraceae bacterium]
MVNHVTSVMPERSLSEARAADLGAALVDLGFERDRRGRAVFRSTTVEAAAARAYLRGRGFGDREFRLVLVYERSWGIL